jgi:ribonuclease H / adenosylcobalamin/alpha-ribazole phosphatase
VTAPGRRLIVGPDGGSRGSASQSLGTGVSGAGVSGAGVSGAADTGPPSVLLLVRHGRTELTEQRRFSGRDGRDAALSAAGWADATAVAELLAGAGALGAAPTEAGPAAAVVCSPLRRARQTAGVIADRLGLSVEADPGWAEISFGQWDGLTLAEALQRWPDQVRAWHGSAACCPPGGESLEDLAARVRAVRAATVTAHPGRVIVVVTHSGPVRAVLQEAFEAGPALLWRTRLDPASVTSVRYWSDGGVEVGAVNLVPPRPSPAGQQPSSATKAASRMSSPSDSSPSEITSGGRNRSTLP